MEVKYEDKEGIRQGDLMFMWEIIFSYVFKEGHKISLERENENDRDD